MNKQIGYITSAHLILFSIAAGYFFISKISTASNSANEGFYNSVITEKAIVLSDKAARGKPLFQSKCASCHHMVKEVEGPALDGFENRGPWADRKQLYKWIRNPVSFMQNDSYTQGLKKKYKIIMTAFPDLTDSEIDAIVDYVLSGS